ncbi:hypothetical protein [Endothiovibrio diazotrophicus]
MDLAGSQLRRGRSALPKEAPPTVALLFASYDLVGSTDFKAAHPNDWIATFTDYFDTLNGHLTHEGDEGSLQPCQPWKLLGDEILFFRPIAGIEELEKGVRAYYQALKRFDPGLPVKGCVWAAVIDNEINHRIPKRNYTPADDFLGATIDEGFRIAHALTRPGFLTVSFDVAHLLHRNRSAMRSNVYHVGYERLKGIWEQRHYPVFWYSENRDGDCGGLPYDAALKCDFVHRYYNEECRSIGETVLNIRDQIGHPHSQIIEALLESPKQ